MSKIPKALGLNEPLRHQDHPRPRTRREFVAQSFMTGAATVVGPSLLAMLAAPRSARAALATDIQNLINPCGITTGAGKIPFICFDLAGGGKDLAHLAGFDEHHTVVVAEDDIAGGDQA